MNPQPLLFAKAAKLETKRLVLRPVCLADAKDMYEYASDPQVTKWVSFPTHQTLDESKEAIAAHFMAAPLGKWGIVYRDTNKFIGTISLMDLTAFSAELGYVINRNFWGQGLVPEAARTLLALAFDELNLAQVHAVHATKNPNSGRVLEKIGMRPVGIFPNYITHNFSPTDVKIWVITREQYLANKHQR